MLVRPIFVIPTQMSTRSPGRIGLMKSALGTREDQSGQPFVRCLAGQLRASRPSAPLPCR